MVKHFPPLAFDDKDYKILEEAKKKHGGNWHDYLLDLSRKYLKGGKNAK